MKKKNFKYLLLLIPFLLITFMYELLPLCKIIIDSFISDTTNQFSVENYLTVGTKLLYKKAIINSITISVKSTVIGIIIAFIGARAVSESKGKIAHFFMTILNMVSNFAGIPLAFAYMILLGNAGIIVQIGEYFGWEVLAKYNLYTMSGMSLIYIYFQIPLATLLLIPAFSGISKSWKEACTLLGGRKRYFWFKIGIPVLMPSILGTVSVLFANALAAYATIYALMMNNISLLPIQIAGSFVGEVRIQKGLGGALSVVMMLIMVIMIFVTNRLSLSFQKGERRYEKN